MIAISANEFMPKMISEKRKVMDKISSIEIPIPTVAQMDSIQNKHAELFELLGK